MSLGRWLLTHSLSLFLVAMLLAAWFWRDELELDRAWAQLRQVGSDMEQGQQATTPSAEGDTVRKSAAAPPSEVEQAASRSPVVQTPEPRSDRTPQPATESPEAQESGGQTPPPAPSPQQRLMQARKAFWSRDFDRAIALYRQLIETAPDNPDYLGELGNIYYNLNRFDQAAELFLKAGTLLVQKGEVARARQLLPALQSLDRELGQQLEQTLQGSTRPAVETQS